MRNILLVLAVLFSYTLSAQYIHVQEDFNDTILPAGWSTTAITGSGVWRFGIDGSSTNALNNNLDGTPMAYFDDDALGQNATNNRTQLVSKVFDNSSFTNTLLEFDYNFRQFNGPLDSFYVEVFDGTNWINVFSTTADDCGNWLNTNCRLNTPHSIIDISPYSNTNCQVRFTYFDGNDWCWYIGIDNVFISSIIAKDLGISKFLYPSLNSSNLTANEFVNVQLENKGTDTVFNYSITCNFNNGAQVFTENITRAIYPQDTFNFTFTNSIDLSSYGSHLVDLFVTLAGDSANINDTITIVIQNDSAFNIPYFQDFEGLNTWEFRSLQSSWDIRIPSAVNINSSFSGVQALVTNPYSFTNGNFPDEQSYVYSPWFDLATMTNVPKVSFYLKYFTLINSDSLVLEYTTNNSGIWHKLEAQALAMNWHDVNKFWSGRSGPNYLHVENTLTNLSGARVVQFRFRHEFDIAGLRQDGYAIDDFSLLEVDSIDISVQSLLNPTEATAKNCGLSSENITIELVNKGANTIDSVFLFYQINSGTIYTDTLTAGLAAYTSLQYSFDSLYNFSASNQYVINVWAKAKGDTVLINDSIVNRTINNASGYNGQSFAYFESFESFVDGSCGFYYNMTQGDTLRNGWEKRNDSLLRWHVQDVSVCGGTASNSATGPANDHTAGLNGFGKFMFIEASSPSGISLAGIPTILETPCIDFRMSNTAGLRFWYHRYGANMGDLIIDVLANDIWYEGFDSLRGQSQTSSTDPWKLKKVNLNQFAGEVIKVRFRAFYNGGFAGDMAIDDVEFYTPIQQDVKIEDILLLNFYCS